MTTELLGQQITWSAVLPKTWSDEAQKMIDRAPDVRTGTVWSAGPVAGTAWVIPDDPRPGEGRAVCVSPSPKGHRQRGVDQWRSTAAIHAECLGRMRANWSIPAAIIPSAPRPHALQRGA